MGRFQRSWALTKCSFQVLRSDKELLVFPLVATLAAIMVVATFVLPMFGLGMFEHLEGGGSAIGLYVWGFFFYLVQYFVIFFFNSALVGAAMIRLDGAIPRSRTACASPVANGSRSSATRRSRRPLA